MAISKLNKKIISILFVFILLIGYIIYKFQEQKKITLKGKKECENDTIIHTKSPIAFSFIGFTPYEREEIKIGLIRNGKINEYIVKNKNSFKNDYYGTDSIYLFSQDTIKITFKDKSIYKVYGFKNKFAELYKHNECLFGSYIVNEKKYENSYYIVDDVIHIEK